jgi:hypothetical protein
VLHRPIETASVLVNWEFHKSHMTIRGIPRSSSLGFYRAPLLFWNRGPRLMNPMQKRVGGRFDVRIGWRYNSECESQAAEDNNLLVLTMISARAGESRAI